LVYAVKLLKNCLNGYDWNVSYDKANHPIKQTDILIVYNYKLPPSTKSITKFHRWFLSMFKYTKNNFVLLFPALLGLLILPNAKAISFPYAEVGLTQREAVAHMLNRFTFGPRPNQISQIMNLGLEKWFQKQLKPQQPSVILQNKLSNIAITNMTTRQILNCHPNGGQLRTLAIREGVLPKDQSKLDKDKIKSQLHKFSQDKGFRTQNQLIKELRERKILRAIYSDQQLIEVLVDFWFNHFNVSATHGQARVWIPSYEEEAIRPNVLGKFRGILSATAKHPAMLYYLDNHQSNAKLENQIAQQRKRKKTRSIVSSSDTNMMMPVKQTKRKKNQGVNENYARELLELHTLGVDGNYTQKDVIETARALTGWKINTNYNQKKQASKKTTETYFAFVSKKHDIKAKIFLGHYLAPNRGIEDGEQILDIIAQHPSTARHIASKLAIRFVTEKPTDTYVEWLARVFLSCNGDLSQMMIAIANSPTFWAEAKRYKRTKSPFRMIISTLRILEGEIFSTTQLSNRIGHMGQLLYACQPPTGYADTRNNWINASAVLHRANFGLDLLAGRVKGVTTKFNTDLSRQPLSMQINVICSQFLPTQETAKIESQIRQTLARLPSRNDKPMAKKIKGKKQRRGKRKLHRQNKAKEWQIAQIAGLIIGSPQFQVY